MHVPDGFIPLAVNAAGYAITAGATAIALRQINKKEDPRAEVPKAALLTAAFFVASSIPIPVPPVTAHLVLAGLMGVMLGWYAFPAILVGLVLQFLVFTHGGITTLGTNACIMGLPAIASHYIFQMVRNRPNVSDNTLRIFGFIAGSVGILLAVAMFYGIVITTIPANIDAALEQRLTGLFALAHLPIALIEGVFTALLVPYLRRVRPDMIGMQPALAVSAD